MDLRTEALLLHEESKGKIEVVSRVSVKDNHELSVAYTPGVAEPCLEIQKDVDLSYVYTRRQNLVAVITDGTAVLGLGDIGPEAGMPVMEGKCVLLKTFGGVDAFPLCLKTKDPEEIIRTVYLLSGSFGGINLEDISAPRCFEIETRLKQICDIPVFHDDQHGTAIIVGAAILNACKVLKKDLSSLRAVINGAGAAGLSIARYLLDLGIRDMIVCDRFGIIEEGNPALSPEHRKISVLTNRNHLTGKLADAMKGADLFIGVSGPNCVTKDMVASMNQGSIVFPLANPVPEISHDDALAAGATIVGTGSSRYPNQINNVLAFPGIFRGALDVRAKDINPEMMMAATLAIASAVPESELSATHLIPFAFDARVHQAVAKAVSEAAVRSGVARLPK